jgi:nucleoside-diphosphate-sugar epimerase
VDVATQPGAVRAAVAALAPAAGHYLYVSSRSVYADESVPGLDERAAIVQPLDADELRDPADYGAAKVACEQAVLDGFGSERALVARSGLIGGPGDATGRSTYWPWRFARPADPDGAVLVPDATGLVELTDVRDLAAWLLRAAEAGLAGVFNTAGESLPLLEHLAVARRVAGHAGPLVLAAEQDLLRLGVEQWMGPRSLPLWVADPAYAGLGSCDSRRAVAAGLRIRPLEETLADGLADELASGRPNPHGAGLTDDEERELLAAVRGRG